MNHQNRDRQPQQPEKTIGDFFPEYLKAGYFDSAGNLEIEFVTREKMESLAEGMTKAYPALTSNQIRRYFQHCRALETKLKSKQAEWEQLRAEFQKLDMSAADAYGKSPRKIPRLFHDFIKANVAAVKTERDFLEGFLPHFEALVGFGSKFFKSERN
ncbi:type III-A CRISPR-associated protein Csm2 [candidate division KSB1 bacterium]|nr:type III-A CRISPR-associated protein Csm2 [candidate division KSB1 bacterium]